MSPIDTVRPASAPLIKKTDWDMMLAFGLGNDVAHWSRMKAAAIRVCLAELPPNSFAQNTKHRLGLTKNMVKALRYRDDLRQVTDYVWEYVPKPWREVFAYDIQYLQKKYPAEDAKNVIIQLISRWNESCDDSMRRYADGRDLRGAYLIQRGRNLANTSRTNNSQPPEDSTTDATNRMNNTEVVLSQSEQVMRISDVHWPSVVLDIQYLDQSEKPLDGLAFSFICGLYPCAPGNIQIKIVEDDLQAQNVNIANFSLQLRGSQEKFGWSLRNICLVLTLWSRTRSEDESDVHLLLVPHEVDPPITEVIREEIAPVSTVEAVPFIKQEYCEEIETSSPRAVRHDPIPTSTHVDNNTKVMESLTHVEPEVGLKREREEISLSNEQASTISSDPRLAKRARREKKESE